MEAVDARLTEATQRIRRAEDQIAITLPGIERNYLLVEKRYLQAAAGSAETARRDLEESRQDFDLVMNSLRKEQEHQ